MSDETISIVQKFIESNVALFPNWFWLEFFGGEPLLCLRKVLQLAKYAREICIYNNVYFIGSITTNGVLITKSTLEKLCDAGITQFQITLDGMPNFHDTQRTFISGRGTWKKVWNALLCFKKSSNKFKVVIRVHYNIANLQETIDLIRNYINPVFSEEKRFLIKFEEVKFFGGSALRDLTNTQEKQTALEQLKSAISNPQIISPITDNYVCYATKSHSVVIMPDGNVTNCTVNLKKIGKLESSGHVKFDADRISTVCSSMQKFCEHKIG